MLSYIKPYSLSLLNFDRRQRDSYKLLHNKLLKTNTFRKNIDKMSNLINKVKDALSSDSNTTHTTTGHTTGTTATTGTTGNIYTTGTTGTAEGVAGPHSSRLANALDPRVDSDMDDARRVGTTTGTTGITRGNNYTTGTTGTVEGMAGPHSSRLANTLDPRVDSDMNGSTRVGGTTTGMTGGNAYNTGTTETAATTGTTGGLGPHSVS